MKLEQNDAPFIFSTTSLPDVFFTEYLSYADGNYIKIYLYMVFLAKYGKDIKVNDLAKTLQLPLKTIQEGTIPDTDKKEMKMIVSYFKIASVKVAGRRGHCCSNFKDK